MDIGHPKDVNVFKNVVASLNKRGHDVKLVARAKENTKKVLEDYGLICEFGPYYKNIIWKACGIPINDLWLYNIAKKFKPDIFVSPGSPYSAHVSKAFKKPHIAFIDTEIATLATKLMLPFTEMVYTSSSFYKYLGPKHHRFNSYYELAYLSPKYFNPNKDVIKTYGLKSGEYIILRLSALASHHDLNAKGFSFKNEEELNNYIKELENYGTVIVSSEKDKLPAIKDHQLNFDPKDLHHILYFAKLYIGEGASMASEAAILGIPSIYVSNTRRGYLNELEERYGLVYSISTKDKAFEKAVEILGQHQISTKWVEKRNRMLSEKEDVVKVIVDAIEGVNEH